MAITTNNVQNVKFLRNGTLYESREAARTALETNKSLGLDGSAILARYQETGKDVKTLVGFVYNSGSTYTVTIFDIDDAGSDVEKKIQELREEINDKLGEGVTSANTATAQFQALSGTSSSSSADTSVWGAKKYADQKLSDAINALDYSDTAVAGKYVSQVTEADGIIAVTRVALPDASSVSGDSKVVIDVTQDKGQITATSANLTGVKLDGLTTGSDAKIASANTLGEALANIQAQIDAMDKGASAEDGKVVTTVTEVDGKVTETKANVKDLQLGGYSKDTTATGNIASGDTINAALSKLENKVAANAISNDDGSITVTQQTGDDTDIAVHIKDGEKVIKLDGEGGGIYTDIDLVKITTGLPAEIKERYQLLASDDTQIGTDIDIYKDSSIVSITYITDSSDLYYQNLEYVYIDASGATQTEYVDISSLVLEAEFASGITVTNHVAHGVVDSTSETFLTVGANGFKLSGVQDAIDAKVNALDVTGDTAVTGAYVAAIEQTDGVVGVKSRANVSEATLNNYAKGSDSGAVASTDTINEAISKLENRIDGEVAAIDADIAAEAAARKLVTGQNGDTYTANSSANYISGATDLNNADVKLDAALKALSDATVNEVQVNGVALTETANAVNVQIDSAAASGTTSSPITVTTDQSTGAVTLQILEIDCGEY